MYLPLPLVATGVLLSAPLSPRLSVLTSGLPHRVQFSPMSGQPAAGLDFSGKRDEEGPSE